MVLYASYVENDIQILWKAEMDSCTAPLDWQALLAADPVPPTLHTAYSPWVATTTSTSSTNTCMVLISNGNSDQVALM